MKPKLPTYLLNAKLQQLPADQPSNIVCMAMDAFRCCLGMKPLHYDVERIVKWMRWASRNL